MSNVIPLPEPVHLHKATLAQLLKELSTRRPLAELGQALWEAQTATDPDDLDDAAEAIRGFAEDAAQQANDEAEYLRQPPHVRMED